MSNTSNSASLSYMYFTEVIMYKKVLKIRIRQGPFLWVLTTPYPWHCLKFSYFLGHLEGRKLFLLRIKKS